MSDNEEQKTKIRQNHARGNGVADKPASLRAETDRTRVKHIDQKVTVDGFNPENQKSSNQNSSDVTRYKARDENVGSVNTANKTRVKQSGHRTASKVDTPVGAQIRVLKGRFILERVIGVGGMGVVYKAKDRLKVEAKDRDPYVAIKVLSEEFKSHPEAFIALQRESRKTQRIAHPNVVKVYDFDRDGDVVFMTMEYMEGRPLDQLIKQYHSTGLPRDDAWNILFGMCSALAYAHNENIVHSDFKPGNVFVTESGMAKIFDFGIARAVAIVDRKTGATQDRTVFDAGSLGALTPAYASMEMLLGKTPDLRDDVYALGCIAYELLTGDHPFNRLPADEAYNKNLKPKRINDISKRRWRAIEKALSFKRKDRIESVEEFHHQLTVKNKPILVIAALFLVVVGLSAFAYNQILKGTNIITSQTDMRDELTLEIRYKVYKEKIGKLLQEPTFSIEWEDAIWEEFKGVYALFDGEPDDWMLAMRANLYKLYINNIRLKIKEMEFSRAAVLLDNAYRYTDDVRLLDNERGRLAEMIKKNKESKKRMAEVRLNKHERNVITATKNKNNLDLYNLALNNVNQQLKCQAGLNMRDLKIAITKLRSLDFPRYARMEGAIVNTLSQCITRIGINHPEKALDDKKYALRIFNNNPQIMAIAIRAREACDMSIAGLGARGDRAICRDKIIGGGMGPAMVVVPGNNSIRAFAIGKYEVSNRQLATYCKESGECTHKRTDDTLPASDISIQTVKLYLQWLNKKTKQKYRLPTYKEWLYAANSTSAKLDPNRNCQLSSRGIEKGGELVRINTGKQNSWGLVNHVGNVQEWVYTKGRKLFAVGGSYQASMDKCTIVSSLSHDGKPDHKTGIRLVREIAN